MDEEESLALAQAAIDDDDPEKAQAILDRFDAVHGEGATATMERTALRRGAETGRVVPAARAALAARAAPAATTA